MPTGTQGVCSAPGDPISCHPTAILNLRWGGFPPKSPLSSSGKGLRIGPGNMFAISYNLSRCQSWAFKFVRVIENSFSFFKSAWTPASQAGDCFQSSSGQCLYNPVSHQTTGALREELSQHCCDQRLVWRALGLNIVFSPTPSQWGCLEVQRERRGRHESHHGKWGRLQRELGFGLTCSKDLACTIP